MVTVDKGANFGCWRQREPLWRVFVLVLVQFLQRRKENLKIREGKRLAQGHTVVPGQKKQFPDSWPRILFLILSYLPPLCRSHFCWENKGVESYLFSFLPFY